MFIAELFTVAKIWKQPKCQSMVEWIKMWYILVYNETLLSHIKEVLPFATTDGPGGYYAKCNISDGERQIPYDFTYMWNLKKHNK